MRQPRPMLDWTIEELDKGHWYPVEDVQAPSRDAAAYQWMETRPSAPRFRVVPKSEADRRQAARLTDSGLAYNCCPGDVGARDSF